MSAGGPNPDRFIENNPTYRAMSLVAWRYGEAFSDDARVAIDFIAPLLRAGVPPMIALRQFEERPIGPRPRYETTWDYEER